MKRPYNDAYLLAFSQEHVWYEVWMFYEMVDLCLLKTPNPVMRYATAFTDGSW